MSAHDGLARSIRPAHTPLDGDTLFAMATGAEPGPADVMLLSVMAAEATALATVDAIRHAQSVQTLMGWVPAASSLGHGTPKPD
jgi:L-aminopeptidase/D-esterase-like protein